MIQGPCNNCKDRFPSCHVTCEKYITFKKELDEWKTNINKERNLQLSLDSISLRKNSLYIY